MPRADRLATLWLFHPLRRCVASLLSARVAILMYHSVSEASSNGLHPYFETTTSPRVFAEHMKFLCEAGYRTLKLDEAVNYVKSPEQPSEPSVVLTFDDGFQDFSTHAFPILHRYGFTATVFLPTAYIGDRRRQLNTRGCLTWAEVRALHRVGVTFGSHTVTHPLLNFLNAGELEQEVRRSKETIEDQIGDPVDSFSYPFAFPETHRGFKTQLRDLLGAQGYRNGVSTIIGTCGPREDQFFLPRLPVNAWDDRRLFRAKLEGGYDWLHSFQYARKLATVGGP